MRHPVSALHAFFQNLFREIAITVDGAAGSGFAAVLCVGVLLLGAVCPAADAQTGEWAWMGGQSAAPGLDSIVPGVYGTLGVPAAGNAPGSRWQSVSWTDSSGNLWLFGGGIQDSHGDQGYFSDLWEFNHSAQEWVWMGGSNAAPCSASACSQPANGVYGQIKSFGPGNTPGGRMGAVSWADHSGNLWLLGGQGADSNGNVGYLNDLWEFNPNLGASGEWAWMGGSSTVPVTTSGTGGQLSVNGTWRVAGAGNAPGLTVVAISGFLGDGVSLTPPMPESMTTT